MKFYLALTIRLFLAIPAWATTFENVAWLGCYDGDTCTFTLPGALTLDDSRENSGGFPGARAQVTEGQLDRGGRAIGLARHVHNPTIAWAIGSKPPFSRYGPSEPTPDGEA